MTRRSIGIVVLGCALVAGDARAQATPEDRAVAETLFQEGRRLMREKRYAEACPKLEESHRIASAGGTLLNLAACHEAVGRVAAAWAEYRDAEAQAKKTGRRDREKIARARSEALAPLVPKLIVVVPPEVAAQGARISRDGSEVGSAAWGVEIPLDPGPHTVRAVAAGRLAWETRVELATSKVATVTVPLLELEAAPAPPPSAAPVVVPPPPPAPVASASAPPPVPPPSPPPPAGPGAQRIVGWTAVGLGAVSLGIGAYFGVRAIGKRSDADGLCTAGGCTPEGFTMNEDARSAARTSNLFLLIGVALASGGATLVLTAPGRPTEISLAPNGAGGALRVRW